MVHSDYTPRYRNYVLFILFLTYILNFLDRQLMTILLEPIKQEFGASDTAMGFLTGKYRGRNSAPEGTRGTIDPRMQTYFTERNFALLDAMEAIGE